MTPRYIIFVFLLSVAALACKKERKELEDCSETQNAIITGNKETVGAIINNHINNLASPQYTQDNMNKLAASLIQSCNAVASVPCFDCIKTLPTQTEIKITYLDTGTPVEKIIDISYTPSNKMVFVNLHD